MITLKTVARHPGKMREVSERAIKRELNLLGAIGLREAKLRAPANTGALRNSILLSKHFVAPPFAVEIGTNLPYAVVMEEGRRPGRFPPILAIFRWVWLKRGSFAIRGKSKSATKNAQSLAFVIARSIAKKGIEGRKYFESAAKEMELFAETALLRVGFDIKKAWDTGR